MSLDTIAPVLVRPKSKMVMTEIQVDDPKQGEVRIKMFASGVCHSYLHAYDGSHETPMPMIFGDEGSGIIEKVGLGVTKLVPGGHVIISWLLNCGTCPPYRNGYLDLDLLFTRKYSLSESELAFEDLASDLPGRGVIYFDQ